MDLKSAKVGAGTGAADAFAFTIAYRGTTLAFDDVTAVPKQVKKLNTLLSRLVQKYDES